MTQKKKILVVLGAAESGVGAALLGVQQGWQVFVSDGGTIKQQFKDVLEQHNIAYEQGTHTLDKILTANCIVKSPGISEKVAIMKTIRSAGVEVCSEIEFAFRYKGDSKVIAITGSNGKSTTTTLIWHLLKESGYDAALVGNIGRSFAWQVADKPVAWYVVEVSSFQLDDIQTFKPDIAVLLNITPDHLDRYDYKFENYIASKFRITAYQDEHDHLVINADDSVIKEYVSSNIIHANTIFFTMEPTNITSDGAFIRDERMHIRYNEDELDMSIHDLTIRGKHNQYNSMAAGISARIAGIRTLKIRDDFKSFHGLDHRLEFVATVRGVDFIDDSKGTNMNSVWYALECMKKPVVLILGGQDKGNDYTEIEELIYEKVKAIVCLGLDNSPIHTFFDGKVPHIVDTRNPRDAVLAAYTFAEKGDVVLLSPGCASFDLFENYADRGDQFKLAVRNL